MYNILIIDDSFLKVDDYMKALINYKNISVIDVISNVEEVWSIIEKKRIDLIVLNKEIIIRNDVEIIKKIRDTNQIPILFLGYVNKGFKGSTLDFKVNMLKNYFDSKKNIGNKEWIIVIGSSTGGPRALQEVIPRLPSNINAKILIVQHMPANFTASLAERLNMSSALDVREARNNETLKKGTVYIAPGDFHMRLKKDRSGLHVHLDNDEKVKGVRPAVDVLMDSVAKNSSHKKMGVILTGMGSDGAEGIIKMKDSGSYNIIQDEGTCVVYGMPRSAYETGCIDEVVELNRMAEVILLKVGVQ